LETHEDVARRTLSIRALPKSLIANGRMKVGHRIIDSTIANPGLKELCALAVMTKVPRAGNVKTRLVPPLTHDEAAQINICFLQDTANALARASGVSGREIGVYTPVGGESVYASILPCEFELLPQRGDDFGERLANAAADLFKIGFGSVCLIDSDSPTVPAATYARAIELLSLKGDRVVLGPSDDGGYYLIGLKQLHCQLFEEIDWSTERVLEQTMARAAGLALEIQSLPTFYDIDNHATLYRLCEELLGDRTRSATAVAPHTREFLRAIIAREGRGRIWPREFAGTK